MSQLRVHEEDFEQPEDCDYDAVNDSFRESVSEELDCVLEDNFEIRASFHEKLYELLIGDYAEDVYLSGVQPVVKHIIQHML
jgi:hypothetical protein